MHRTMKGLRLVRMAALFFLTGIGVMMPDIAEAQQPRFQIQGTVFEAESRAPLAGAQVTLRGTSQGTLTDKDGRFSLGAAVPAGTYTIAVSFIGRATQTRPVTLTPGQATVVLDPFNLTAAAVSLGDVVGTAPGAQSERRTLGNAVATVRD
jgi:hypothetical protein